MLSKIRALKEKKGFTLVELIVVLVILAILAALLVPALTGYIDRANNQKVIATTRQVVMAAQTCTSEAYGKAGEGKLNAGNLNESTTPKLSEVVKLAEVATVSEDGTPSYKNGVEAPTITITADGHVSKVVLTQSGKTCTYEESTGTYTVKPKTT